MINWLKRKIESLWYEGRPWKVLSPLPWAFRAIAAIRRQCYHWRLLRSHALPVPVIVVGNITVGGNGKTPLVISIVELLQKKGFRPGIVLRGYGGKYKQPTLVTAPLDTRRYGDEAVLLARRTNVPVVVAKKRAAGGQFLLAETDVDVVIADDGLQHYALQRDIEIAVIDENRQFGNGLFLPLGPLRESPKRLSRADFVILHGASKNAHMSLNFQKPVNLATGHVAEWQTFQDKKVHAVAGIGNPKRFFNQLSAQGLQITEHPFVDHYSFDKNDFQFPDEELVMMTEKDAVKCRAFAKPNMWYVPVEATLNKAFQDKFVTKVLKVSKNGQKVA